jgi:conjugal transfer pilus assembly protein TraL
VDEDQRRLLIPRRLDDGTKFLFWDFDVAALVILGLGFGIFVGFILLGGALGFALAYLWSKAKAGRHSGYGLHFLYWHTPLTVFKRTPPSARRQFTG